MRVAFTRMLAASARPSRSIGRMWSRPGHNPIAVVRDRELDPIPLALDYDGIQTFQQARKFCDAKHRFNVVRTFLQTHHPMSNPKPDNGTHCCVISATVGDIAPRSCFTTRGCCMFSFPFFILSQTYFVLNIYTPSVSF